MQTSDRDAVIPYAVRQVALRATDLDVASSWWADLLGTEPKGRFDGPGLLFFDIGETRLLLSREAPESLVYLHVDDIHGAVERARGMGARIDTEPHVIFTHEDGSLGPHGNDEWHAFFLDPHDNMVGLIGCSPRTRPGRATGVDTDQVV